MRKIIIFSAVFLTLIAMLYSCQTAEKVEQDAYYVNGRDIYIAQCQNCHGEKGEGLAELSPPLTDTVWMKKNRSLLACIIKYGYAKPVTIHGKVYQGKMPDFNMANIDLTQIIVYVTNTFGHKQGKYTTDQVAKDLENCK